METDIQSTLASFKVSLSALYGDRLRNVFMFGSHARGEQAPESDLDVLIVLDQIDRYGEEVDRTGEITSMLSLRCGISLGRVFVSENDWGEARTPLLQAVRREALPV
jgi:uncharacterized protein